jgi:nucleotide-binding universal stress UspA family protein
MSRIVVAVDGLPGSEKALETAVWLARQDGGEVAAVTVLDNSGGPHQERLLEGLKGPARRHLEEVLQAAANFARSRGVRLTPALREGHPAEAILSFAEEEGADVLVVGSHNSPARPGLGGTADRVSAHAPCTVVIAR